MIDTKVSRVLLRRVSSLTLYRQLVGMNWIEVPPGRYSLRQNKTSHCQLEFSMKWVYFFFVYDCSILGGWSLKGEYYTQLGRVYFTFARRRVVYTRASPDS